MQKLSGPLLLENRGVGLRKHASRSKYSFQYVRRDLRYIDVLLAHGASLNERQTKRLAVIRELFDQQMFMYENRTHRVPGRIVSLAQPWICPINRGKAKQ